MDNTRYTVVVNGKARQEWWGLPLDTILDLVTKTKQLNPGAGVYALAESGEIIYSRRGDEEA